MKKLTLKDLAIDHGGDCSHYDENTDHWDDWSSFVANGPLAIPSRVVWRWDVAPTAGSETEGLIRFMLVDTELGTVRAHVVRLEDQDVGDVVALLRIHWARMWASWAPLAETCVPEGHEDTSAGADNPPHA